MQIQDLTVKIQRDTEQKKLQEISKLTLLLIKIWMNKDILLSAFFVKILFIRYVYNAKTPSSEDEGV